MFNGLNEFKCAQCVFKHPSAYGMTEKKEFSYINLPSLSFQAPYNKKGWVCAVTEEKVVILLVLTP